MVFLKLEYEQRPLKEGGSPRQLFEYVRGDYGALLESGKHGRYSYIVADPFLTVSSEHGTVSVEVLRDFGALRAGRSILDQEQEWAVTDLLKKFPYKDESPVPFFGGAVGFLSYDYGCRFVGVEQNVHDDVGIPDYVFGFYDQVVAFDHEEGLVYFLAVGETDLDAKRSLQSLMGKFDGEVGLRRRGEIGTLQSSVSESVYSEKISQVRRSLQDGDTYQVNYAVRFDAPCTMDGWTIYKRLAELNPSPFACYLDYPEMKIVSSSPELLLRKRGMRLETWPIKGTVPRGADDGEDDLRVQELKASEKDEAELSMIVDLARNDLGRVCEPGSVKVDAHRDIEKYSHVIHTVSRVSGEMARGATIFDAIKAVFPGGSITGCPKKRTMEIIDRLESYKRGVYTGSAGFISFKGDMDLNILIRTMLLKDDRIYFNAGGGIVIDSQVEAEYAEVQQKARAMLEAITK